MNNTAKILRNKAFNTLKDIGAASGIGNRARTIPSRKDKAEDPRRQRKNRNWATDTINKEQPL